ncbi:MAG: O-antigen ligase family protein [Kaiparowitsia implicata GSE-PSE-MK54-09C]|jgi:O-antigen ligase|nr:O-antigen ligase family protein [Kaiparowitsia implicata GSE-PSE-MK54-09C]
MQQAISQPTYRRQSLIPFRTLFRWFEHGFTVFSLVVYSGGPFQVIMSGGISEGQQAAVETDFAALRAIFMLTYAVFMGLLVLRWKRTLVSIIKTPALSLLIGMAVLSYVWSAFPSVTMSRSIALVGTCAFGLYFGTRFDLKQQLKLLAWGCGICTVLSVAFIAVLPQYGVMAGVHAGAWRGIYVHKNVLGRMMVFAALVALLCSLQKGQFRLMHWMLFVTSTVLMVMSQSMTATVNYVVLMLMFFLLRPLRWRFRARTIALMSILLALSGGVFAAMANPEVILTSLGRDATLTGRTSLWPEIIQKIELRPFFGYGYEGFWRGWNSDAAEIWRAVRWTPPHAHNGFLDLLLALGIVGMVIFTIEYLTSVAKAAELFQKTNTSEYFLPILFLAFTVLFSLTESTIMGRNSTFWVIYVAIASGIRMAELRSPQLNRGLSSSSDRLSSEADPSAIPTGRSARPNRL